jgi:hypothetical protein
MRPPLLPEVVPGLVVGVGVTFVLVAVGGLLAMVGTVSSRAATTLWTGLLAGAGPVAGRGLRR